MYGHDSGTNSGLQLFDSDLLHFYFSAFLCCSSDNCATKKCVLVETLYNNKNTFWFWKGWNKNRNNVQLEEKVTAKLHHKERRPFTKKWPRNPNGPCHGDVKRTHFATLHQINLGEVFSYVKGYESYYYATAEKHNEREREMRTPTVSLRAHLRHSDARQIWGFIQSFTVA